MDCDLDVHSAHAFFENDLQVDRAKAAFARALEIDRENVNAMVGAAILDMASLDETSKEFNTLMEKAIKMMSMANLLDHSNAMVQNHLANHYFWKWTPVSGTVQVTQGSNLVKGSQPIPLDPGERIRIGPDFETHVTEDTEEDNADEEGTTFRMRDPWKGTTIANLKVWKKDYDRVIALAKGAYNSTSVQDIQAESLFFLARVYHVKDDIENAHKFYERACKLAPNLSPARFGLAQTLIAQEEYEQAAAHLQLVLGTSSTATDALAALGLLEVKGGKKPQEGLAYLRKAIDLDPLNPDLVLLEALALQQHESNYVKALERYRKAIQLMKRQGKKVSFEVFTNIGVLCHETKAYDESLKMYMNALDSSDEDGTTKAASLDNIGIEGGYIRHYDNYMFFEYVDTELQLEKPPESEEGTTTLKIAESSGKEASSVPLRIDDHIRLGKSFESQIVEIASEDGSLVLKIKKPYKEEKDEENEDRENEAKEENRSIPLFVKRENHRLDSPKAISIAFNLARLHETGGRTLAAVELHKAILKRNPAYVNSYLRLACIAIDCGALKECAGWLKIAAETAPGNPEVLTLIGNLHLSLCDWAPAQQVFDGLLAKKVPNVEAYAMLSLGNIYFANLKISPKRYLKHLQYAADYYKRILTKDTANAYAANGLGTVLAEKGELFKAKEVFNRVREVSGDAISDAHLNLGHIYLAQKKHPEALQMYQSYLKRTEDGTAPISSKSRVDDTVDVLLYISFAFFDWARQTELYNNAKAAPADERYKQAMKHLELALSKNTSKAVVLTYNLCMTKLQAANCVLQKLTRNIRRTAQEVEEALNGLQESLTTVEQILKNKTENQMKVPIATSMLNDFITHCKSNIESAKSHLEDERKREEEANELRELQRLASESQRKEQAIREQLKKEQEIKEQEERDRKVSYSIVAHSYVSLLLGKTY
jgi:RNA polymerase-associated protein CTR9